MATTRRFAEDTDVSASKTHGEIKDQLRLLGADEIGIHESRTASSVIFRFARAGMYRITVPVDQAAKNPAQEERRAWRLVGLLVKAKIQAIRENATTIEREFLADRLLYDGRTVAEAVGPELQIAQEAGRVPSFRMIGGPKT